MTDSSKPSYRDPLSFLGKAAAGISHDIKNGLAVVKEQSGLALDLMEMAESTGELDQERIRSLLRKVVTRIDATDQIVKDLNRLAHTTDEARQVFDLSVMLSLIERIAARQARNMGVEIEITRAPEQVQMESRPLMMLQFLFMIVMAASAELDDEGMLKIAVEADGSSVCYIFSGIRQGLAEALNGEEDCAYMIGKLDAGLADLEGPTRTKVSFAKILRD